MTKSIPVKRHRNGFREPGFILWTWIQRLWWDVKKLADARCPSNLSQLADFCREEGATLPINRCEGLVSGYRRCLFFLMAAKGGATSSKLKSSAHFHMFRFQFYLNETIRIYLALCVHYLDVAFHKMGVRCLFHKIISRRLYLPVRTPQGFTNFAYVKRRNDNPYDVNRNDLGYFLLIQLM